MKVKRTFKQGRALVGILMVLAVLLNAAGCRPQSATPTPVAPVAKAATATRAEAPTSKPADTALPATPAPPTPTHAPTVTPTPLPPQAPRVLERSPERGEELATDGAIVLQFDQPMDASSVEEALEISPEVAGAISWDDAGSVARFVPEAGFERDTLYRVSLGTSARSNAGLALAQPVMFSARSVGFLEVTSVSPLADAIDVPVSSAIRVIFNRPVVPLTYVSEQGLLDNPLTFSPPIAGSGRWTNTSIYTYEPSSPLAAGTAYTVKVAAGLTDTTGGVLEQDYVWSFTTQRPDVVSISPADGMRHVAPDAAVEIAFNQPMQRVQTESRFSLTAQGASESVAGSFDWRDEGLSKHVLVFTPNQPLERGQSYTVRLAAGAPSVSGNAAVASDYEWRYQVAGIPSVLSHSPRNATLGVDPGQGIRITFSSPISESTFIEGLVISPESTVYTWWQDENTVVHISTSLKPSTKYSVQLNDKIQGLYGGALANPLQFEFTTAPLPASVWLDVPDTYGTYNAYAVPTVRARFRNLSEINLALYRMQPSDFVTLNRDGNWGLINEYTPDRDALVRAWSAKVNAPLNETGIYTTTLSAGATGQPLASGFYFMTCKSPQTTVTSRHVLLVSDMNVTLKVSDDEVLAWVTDLQSGQPVAGVDIAVYGGKGGLVGSGSTDADGVSYVAVDKQEPWSAQIVIAKRAGDDGALSYGAAMRSWSNGIYPWDFGLPGAFYQEDHRAFLYTERDIYRPGQTVYFKGILRLDDDGAYSLPPEGAVVKLIAMDSQGRQFWQKELPVSAIGTLHDSIELDAEAATGYYQLQGEYQPMEDEPGYFFGASFQVAEYRKPEFQVSVALDQADYVNGDVIRVIAESTYYFGGPVGDAVVRWRVLAAPYYFSWDAQEGHYSFSDYDAYERDAVYSSVGGIVTEGEGQTDDNGLFEFLVPAEIGERVGSQTFTVEVSVQDINNQEVSARSSASVHAGDFYIGLSPVAYVGTVAQEQSVRVVTVDPQGDVYPDQPLEVVVAQHEWLTVREQADDGYFYWTSKVRETPVAAMTVTTDADGKALVSFTPTKGGAYKVTATGLDNRENSVRSATYLWVSDTSYVSWRQDNHDRIELVADKETYEPGDMATVLIPSPYQGNVVALMTIERGSIIEHKLLTLTSNSEQLHVPILPTYAPNVYLSVVIVKGADDTNPVPGFKVGYVMLPVSTKQQELTVRITPDRAADADGAVYRPRDSVVYDVATLDYEGRGVAAEVSLQLVDLAVQALTGGGSQDIVQTFYRERPLGIQTATSLALSVDRHNLDRAQEGKGGGGGDMQSLMVRQNLPDTAFWAPAVQTDSSGHAKVEVTLPDNLTTWRMTAQAVTPATKVGTGSGDIVSTLDVMIRPVTPRFLVVGDKPILGAVVHNNTAEALTLEATLEATGLELGAPPAVTLDLPAHSRQAVQWPATVDATEEVLVLFKVAGGGYSDALELTLPVYHVSTPETVGTAGAVEDRTVELIRVPGDADTSAGQLSVLLEPSLAAGMREGLRYLETYPYGCIEQTVSRFLPNVVTYRALGELGIDDSKLAARLPQEVGVALQRLYTLQQLDGGWGWWGEDKSSAGITAYVLLGLTEARRADFLVDQNVVERASAFLRDYLNQEFVETREALDIRATVLYSLAEAGQGDLGRAVVLYEQRANMSLFAKAYLAMALQLLAPDEPSRLATLASEFGDDVLVSATGAHWEEAQRAPWAMNTDTRTTAIVLRALLRIQPDSGLLPNVVRWLMLARQTGRWETTQENVWAILALTDYMVSSGELLADYEYNAWLNGVSIASGSVDSSNLDQQTATETPVSELRLDRDNDLIIERSSVNGQLYYSVFLNYYLPASGIQALNRGIIVDRRYVLVDDGDRPVTEARVNDVIEVRLTLIAPNDLNYLVLEDPLPAGCEAIDSSLATTSSVVPPAGISPWEAGPEYARYGGWWTWVTHSELRDEKVALFANYLMRGTYEYTYQVRCTTPGAFQVMPAVAYEMYAADVFGRTAGGEFTITE